MAHEPTERPLASFMISVGPFFVNSILGMVVVFPASIELFGLGVTNSPLMVLLGWLGVSILMHAFPSTGDAKVMIQTILNNPDVSLFAKVVAAPVIGLAYLGALGSVFWLDFAYAVFMAMVLPRLMVLFL